MLNVYVGGFTMIEDKIAAGFQRQMSFKQYKKYKIRMLTKDFCLPLTKTELLNAQTLKTETQVDQFCVTMLNKYWK